MSLTKNKISYSLAINQALIQLIKSDGSIVLLGQGVKSPWYVGNTSRDLVKRFGEKRVIDTPVSENAVTGIGLGLALAGSRAVVVHPRMDFMLYAMDPIINQAANWNYMYGGGIKVPLVIWGIINRGGEQGAQHSQALYGIFSHIPGLKVVMPSNPYDAKGLMISAVYDNNPVIFIDDRWLYNLEQEVPEEIYRVPIGKAEIKREGKDITIVSASYMLNESLKASDELNKKGIYPEVIDLKTIKPLDADLILKSVKKTGRLLIADASWKSFGVSSEISALVSENALSSLKAPVKRLCLYDAPAPASSQLEKAYYLTKDDIIREVKNILK
ncbi:MAG: transketolase C-terminal domain-containing protein [Candidatus Pacebacteria bacterium]|nr:transketolase C-terminal domain-containing protein [Candidatus Paceibacterota bacterium]